MPVNVAGALGAGRQFASNPYKTQTAPGVIRAPYRAQAGAKWGDAIASAGQSLVQYAEWKEFGEPLAKLNMEIKGAQLNSYKLGNQKLAQEIGNLNAQRQSVYQGLKSSGALPTDMTYDGWTQANYGVSQLAGAAATGALPKDATQYKVANPTQGISSGEIPKTEIPVMSDEQGRTFLNDSALYAQNIQKDLGTFQSKLREIAQKGGEIDQVYNPEEYLIQQSIRDGNKPIAGITNGKASITFTAMVPKIDSAGNEVYGNDGKLLLEQKSVTKLKSQFDGTGKWFSPLEAPATLRGIILSNKDKYANLNNSLTAGDHHGVLRIEKGSIGDVELESLFREALKDPRTKQSLEKNFKLITGNKDFKFYDTDGDADVDGRDMANLARPILNQGRISQSQLDARVRTSKKRQDKAFGATTEPVDINAIAQDINNDDFNFLVDREFDFKGSKGSGKPIVGVEVDQDGVKVFFDQGKKKTTKVKKGDAEQSISEPVYSEETYHKTELKSLLKRAGFTDNQVKRILSLYTPTDRVLSTEEVGSRPSYLDYLPKK